MRCDTGSVINADAMTASGAWKLPARIVADGRFGMADLVSYLEDSMGVVLTARN